MRSRTAQSARKAVVKAGKRRAGEGRGSAGDVAAAAADAWHAEVEVLLYDEDSSSSVVEDTPSADAPVLVCSGPEAPTSVTCVSDGEVHEVEGEADGGGENEEEVVDVAEWSSTSVSSDASSVNNNSKTAGKDAPFRPRTGLSPATPVMTSMREAGVSASRGAATILGASGLTAYFTYGFQSAMQHYAEDLNVSASGQEKNGNCCINAFLLEEEDAATVPKDNSASRSSSAATYDSDVAEDTTEHVLEPQSTSLYRLAPSMEAVRSQTASSWSLSATATTAAAAATARTASPPRQSKGWKTTLRDAFPSQQAEWTSGSAAACFREALRRAYACEDAVRRRQHDEVERQRSQLIRTLEELQSASNNVGDGGAASQAASAARASKSMKSTASTRPSSLSAIAEAVEAAPAASAKRQKRDVKPVSNGKPQRQNAADALYTLEDDSSNNKALVVSAAPSPTARRVLQVMDPAQVHKLRRTPNALVEAFLKHHREAQLKQRGARHAEAQAVLLRRRCELPLLTEDMTRYAVLLHCLKRRPLQRSALSAKDGTEGLSRQIQDGTPLSPVGGAASQLPSQMSGTLPVVAMNDSAESMPPYGEEGSLLYLKYPAPLLRTTSFAVETVRLLKWLRTWRSSGSATGGGGGALSPAPSGSATAAGGKKGGGGGSTSQRKRVKKEATTAVDVVEAPTASAAAGGATKPMVKDAHRQAQLGQQCVQVQGKQAKHSAFMKFFGAAVVPTEVKVEEGGLMAEEDVVSVPLHASSAAAPETPSAIALSSPTIPLDSDKKDTKEEHSIVQSSRPTSQSTTTHNLQLYMPTPPSPGMVHNPAAYAYQLYCYAWRHAVKTGITPLAAAVQAFAGAHPGTPRAARTDPAVPRVCAALRFTDEMKAETQNTALGSAAQDVYYEDAYGNRLRSARLAQKEREKHEQLAAQQRRWAKKKGYFHRGGGEERTACGSAAAMLEAMRSLGYPVAAQEGNNAGCGGSSRRAGQQHKRRRRTRDSSSDTETSDEEGVVVVGQKKAMRGRRACSVSSDTSISGSERSSSSSSSSSSSDSGGPADADAAGALDEITNIAVVSGPTGSGKTAAVYVAAQLLGFRVVEMNASVRRCSKTVEHLLAELTRSHRLSGLRPGASSFNAEEELTRLKQQHAAMLERAKAEAEAADREAAQRRREARKANGISAQAVANFFSKGSSSKAQAGDKAAAAAPASATIVDDAVEEDVAGTAAPPTASPLLPPPPLPTAAAAPSATPAQPAAAGGTRTLLLFEDADILLGDESAKPFYAAIRDLAHRSKVPIVVTVSADPSPSQRYDIPTHTAPFFSLEEKESASPTGARAAAAAAATYWQVCEAAGLNSSMDTLEATYRALQASPVLDDRAAATDNTGGGDGVGGGISPHHANAAASFFPSAKTGASPSTTAAGNGSSSGGVSPPSLPTGGASATTAAGASAISSSLSTQLAARYNHILLNASLVSSFFGTRTPFTVVEALPSSALFAQLLTVGAVELDLLQWQTTPSHDSLSPLLPSLQQMTSGGGDGLVGPSLSPSPSSSSWQHDMDHLTGCLRLRDTRLFFELAQRLCVALFGMASEENGCKSEGDGGAAGEADCRDAQDEPGLSSLSSAVRSDAAQRTTTDIRYWLNRLQMLLLDLRVQKEKSNETATTRGHANNADVAAREDDVNRSEAATKAGEVKETFCRNAEHLLDCDFQQRTSLAASAWDTTLGRYRACLAHNELQSSRYEYWLLDDHVDYVPDVVEELNTQDHPTLRIDYSPAKTTASSSAAARTPKRRGRPPSAASTASATTASQVDAAQTASNSSVAGGLNPAWKALFGGGAPSSSTASPSTAAASSSARAGATSLSGGQQTLFGFPPAIGTGSAAPAVSAGAVVIDPARCTWPPSLMELRRQMNRSASWLRPVDVVLPYSTAQTYYDTAATSSAAADLRRVPDVADPSPHLLGHDTALRFVNRQGGREMEEEEGDVADVTGELPAAVYATQEERAAVLRRWWRRTRKVGALRDHVMGRSAAALEDVLGHSRLLAPSSAAASGSYGSSGQ